jgi:hypothetical protein
MYRSHDADVLDGWGSLRLDSQPRHSNTRAWTGISVTPAKARGQHTAPHWLATDRPVDVGVVHGDAPVGARERERVHRGSVQEVGATPPTRHHEVPDEVRLGL